MRRLLAVLVVAVFALPATASAHTVLYGSPGADQARLQGWIDASAVPTPSMRVRLHAAFCPEGGAWGCMSEPPAEVWVAPAPASYEQLVLMHEVGHFFSDRVLTASDKRAFRRLDGKPRAAWDPAEEDRADSPNEDFGNAYAWCAVGSTPDPEVFSVPPNVPRACALIRAAAARPHSKKPVRTRPPARRRGG